MEESDKICRVIHALSGSQVDMQRGLSLKYIKVHTATRWTIRHSLMLLWFADLMNVTEEVTIHIKEPLVAAFRSPLMKALDRSVETLGP